MVNVDIEGEECKGGGKTERKLYRAVKEALIESGVEHGHAVVRELPSGEFAIVAGEGSLEDAKFVPGGGTFGGGGASGTW